MTQDVHVQGDPERIEAVYRAEAHRLRRALLAFTSDVSLANDAIAEAFAQAIGRGSALRDPTRWVWRTAFRIAAGQMKDRPTQQTKSASQAERASLVDPGFEMAEQSAELLAALASLPPKQRAAVVLHYLADLPTAEVAKRLGVTSTTVRVHLNQGRARLKMILEGNDD